MRYGADIAWMHAYTGLRGRVPRAQGLLRRRHRLHKSEFTTTGLHFPGIDLALLPIAPIDRGPSCGASHMDPEEALEAMKDLGAAKMVPIHYDTIPNSSDEPGAPRRARGGAEEVVARRAGGAVVASASGACS